MPPWITIDTVNQSHSSVDGSYLIYQHRIFNGGHEVMTVYISIK